MLHNHESRISYRNVVYIKYTSQYAQWPTNIDKFTIAQPPLLRQFDNFWESDVDGSGSESCAVAGFGISGVEPSDPANTVLDPIPTSSWRGPSVFAVAIILSAVKMRVPAAATRQQFRIRRSARTRSDLTALVATGEMEMSTAVMQLEKLDPLKELTTLLWQRLYKFTVATCHEIRILFDGIAG